MDNDNKFFDQMPDWFKEEYQKGKGVRDILYSKGITSRNSQIQEEIDNLFHLIDSESKEALFALVVLEIKLGSDDPIIVEAKTSIAYSEFYTVLNNDVEAASKLLSQIKDKYGESLEYIRAESYLDIF